MSVLSVKNLQETFIGGNKNRTASAQITDPSATTTYIADGEIIILTSTGALATTSTTFANSPFIQIAQRSYDNVVVSSKIYGDKVVRYTGKDGAQGTEQIYEIGYNGSTGSIDTSVTGTDYMISVTCTHDDMQWSEQLHKTPVALKKSLGSTQLAVAKAMVIGFMKKYTTNGTPVTAAMLNSGAAATIGAVTAKVVHGSNVVVYSGAPSLSAGNLVRLGCTGSGIGTEIPVYTVKSTHPTIANAVILDMPYAGPSNTALPNADHGLVTAGADYGIRFIGKALDYRRDHFKFKRVSFSVAMTGFGTTILTKVQEATYGSGDGRIVLEHESFSKGFQGALNRMTIPLPLANERFDAVGTSTLALKTAIGDGVMEATQVYETISIEHFSQNNQAVVTADAKMPQLVQIYLIQGAGQNSGSASDIQDVLNAWMASCPAGFANLAVV